MMNDDDKKLEEVMKAVEEARKEVDDYYSSKHDSVLSYGMSRYVPETYRLYFPATVGQSPETLAKWKEMMKAGTSEMPMLTLDEVEDVPLPEGCKYAVYIGEKEVHGFSVRSEAIHYIIDRWLALTDEQRAEIFLHMDMKREEDIRETQTPSPFNRLYIVSWMAYNGESPWRFQLRDPHNEVMLDMTRFPQMLVHTEGDIGIPGGLERHKKYVEAWADVFDRIDEEMKSRYEDEEEEEEDDEPPLLEVRNAYASDEEMEDLLEDFETPEELEDIVLPDGKLFEVFVGRENTAYTTPSLLKAMNCVETKWNVLSREERKETIEGMEEARRKMSEKVSEEYRTSTSPIRPLPVFNRHFRDKNAFMVEAPWVGVVLDMTTAPREINIPSKESYEKWLEWGKKE